MKTEENTPPVNKPVQVGISKKDIEAISRDEINSLLAGRTSELRKFTLNNEQVLGKLRLHTDAGNNLSFKVIPKADQVIFPKELSDEKVRELKAGKSVVNAVGKPEPYLYKLDHELNQVLATQVSSIRIPDRINNIPINAEDKVRLANGRSIMLKNENGEASQYKLDISKLDGLDVQPLKITNDKTLGTSRSSEVRETAKVEKNNFQRGEGIPDLQAKTIKKERTPDFSPGDGVAQGSGVNNAATKADAKPGQTREQANQRPISDLGKAREDRSTQNQQVKTDVPNQTGKAARENREYKEFQQQAFEKANPKEETKQAAIKKRGKEIEQEQTMPYGADQARYGRSVAAAIKSKIKSGLAAGTIGLVVDETVQQVKIYRAKNREKFLGEIDKLNAPKAENSSKQSKGKSFLGGDNTSQKESEAKAPRVAVTEKKNQQRPKLRR